jgi:hypothetical protein
LICLCLPLLCSRHHLLLALLPCSRSPVALSLGVGSQSSDDEPYSFWKATVKTVRGEFYMISYSSWEDEFNEILEKVSTSTLARAKPTILHCRRR